MRATVREPYVAGAFYPGTRAKCEELLARCIPETVDGVDGAVVSAIVPHAGWIFSGPTAGLIFRALKQSGDFDTFILFGAVHVWGVDAPSLFARGAWRTPLGDCDIDEELAGAIRDAAGGLIVESVSAHSQEHSLEVQVPFIQRLFPGARIVPIMVPPAVESADVGRSVWRAVKESAGKKRVAALGSSDLTHYGPNYRFMPVGIGAQSLQWVKDENDKRILDLAVAMRDGDIVAEALTHQNACGPGAMAAACSYAKESGVSQGRVLGYTTSYDVMPDRQPTSFVGYSAVVYSGE